MTLGMDELMKLRAQKQAEAPYIPDEDKRRGYAALMRNTAKKVPTDENGRRRSIFRMERQ